MKYSKSLLESGMLDKLRVSAEFYKITDILAQRYPDFELTIKKGVLQ